MGWATAHIEEIKPGGTGAFRPRGGSMSGRIESAQRCTAEPMTGIAALRVDDIVLRKVKGAAYLHLIKAIEDRRFQIGNNRGCTNGWIGPNSIFGCRMKVEP